MPQPAEEHDTLEMLGQGDPETVGPYRLVARLGAGGMGQVYVGRTAGGRTVAVKTVRPEYAGDPEFRQRFRQEVAAARRVGGNWTAPVLDADTEGERPWVATGYVAGPSLSDAVRQFGPLPVATVLALGSGLAEALAAVHRLGLVHRDVKPSNVLLALDGPRLIDFGIARALDQTSVLTRSGYVVGSPGFMSPEQARGEAPGPAGDVFALGAVLAFAATGTAPFGEKDSAAVLLYRIVHEQPELRGLDGELLAVVRGCLEKDPARRPSPAQLHGRLERCAPTATRLGEPGWLPRGVSDVVARAALELLDLESHPAPGAHPAPTAPTTPLLPPAPTPTPTVPYSASGHTPVAGPVPQPPLPYSHPTPPPAHPAWSGAPPRRPGGRVLALAGIGVGVAVAAGVLTWVVTSQPATGGGAAQAGGTSSPTASAPATTHGSAAASAGASAPVSATPVGTSTDATGAVPQAFVGVFAGWMSSPESGLRLAARVTLVQGAVGDPIDTTETDGGTGTGKVVCTGEATLVSVTANRMVLKPVPLSGISGCTQLPGYAILTLNPDGSLHATQDGLVGDLTRR